MKKKERDARFNALSEMGCCICGGQAAIHHCIGHEFGSCMGRKAPDEMTIPLCHNHHQGKEGIHQIGRDTWQRIYGKQSDLLNTVNLLLIP